jgi:fibrillarin-like pre-rRNA processing protein
VVEREGRRGIATRNLVPGNTVYGETLVLIDGDWFREWNPFRSKLAAAILKGMRSDVIREGGRVLYLGTSTGTTSSHVSDILGSGGLMIGVESASRVAREFVENVARHRKNIIPYLKDARNPADYDTLGKVDVVYCDIAQPDQTEIAIKNCEVHLKEGGWLLLVVKARSIDVVKEPKKVFEAEKRKLLSAGFEVETVEELSPFDKDHAMILARFL